MKVRAIRILGAKGCSRCGTADIRLLTFNHKNGDGAKDRKQFVGENLCLVMAKRILKGEVTGKDVDVRCFNCNILYDYELGARKYPDDYPVDVNLIRLPDRDVMVKENAAS